MSEIRGYVIDMVTSEAHHQVALMTVDGNQPMSTDR